MLSLSLIYTNPRFAEFSFSLTLTALCEVLLFKIPVEQNDLTYFSEYETCKELVQKSLGLLTQYLPSEPSTEDVPAYFSSFNITTAPLTEHLLWTQDCNTMANSLFDVLPHHFKTLIRELDYYTFQYYKLLPPTYYTTCVIKALEDPVTLNAISEWFSNGSISEARKRLIKLSDSTLFKTASHLPMKKQGQLAANPFTPTNGLSTGTRFFSSRQPQKPTGQAKASSNSYNASSF